MKKKFLLTLIASIASVLASAQKYHDAAIFNAPYGDVKYIEFNEGRVMFTKNGKIDKENSPYLSFFKKYLVKYDKELYPISVTTDFDVTMIEYDAQKRIAKRTVQGSSNYVLEYEYKDYSVNETKTVLENGRPVKSTVTYDLIAYDDRKNLTSRGMIGTSHTSTSVSYERIGLVTTGYLSPNFTQTTIVEGHVENDRIIGYYTDNDFEKAKLDTDVTFEESLHPCCIDIYTPKYLIGSLKYSKNHYLTGKFVYNYIKVPQPYQTLYGRPMVNMTVQCLSQKIISEYRYWVTFDNAEQRNDFLVFLVEKLEDQGIAFKRKNFQKGIQFDLDRNQYSHRHISIYMDELDDKTPCVCVSWDSINDPDQDPIPSIKWKDGK